MAQLEQKKSQPVAETPKKSKGKSENVDVELALSHKFEPVDSSYTWKDVIMTKL